MKQAIRAQDPAQQFQMEVAEPRNGPAENLIEPRQSNDFEWLWLLWLKRGTLARWTFRGALVALVIALVIPKQYESTARLMPPDTSSGGGLGMMAAMESGHAGSGGVEEVLGDQPG